MSQIRRNLHRLTIALAGFFILFNYQNCAPGPQGQDVAELAVPPSVIDYIQTGGIQFMQKSLQLASDDENFVIEGQCEDDGAILAWNLWDDQDEQVHKGRVECIQGSFSVEFEGAQDLACGQNFIFSANLGAKSADKMKLSRSCE